MSKHSIGGGGNVNAGGNANDGKNNDRKITGAIRIDGEVKAQLPLELIKEYATSNKKEESRERFRICIEVVTLALVAIAAALSFRQTSLASDTAKSAGAQAQTALDELHLSQRAWVSFEPQTEKLILSIDGGGVFIKSIPYSINNVGHSIANGILIAPNLYDTDSGRSTACNMSEKDLQEGLHGHGGMAIFPSQTLKGKAFAGQGPEFLKSHQRAGSLSFQLITCVYYTTPSDFTIHHTKTTFWVMDANNGKVGFDPTQGSYEVKLVLDYQGTYAD